MIKIYNTENMLEANQILELLKKIVPDFELKKKEIVLPEINSDKKGLKIISGTVLVLALAVMLLYYLL